jgi:hypothetical protein
MEASVSGNERDSRKTTYLYQLYSPADLQHIDGAIIESDREMSRHQALVAEYAWTRGSVSD